MRKIVVGLIFSIICGLNLFGDDVDLGLEAYNKGDFIKANELFTKACNSGNAKSCHNLGLMYANGQGVNQDHLKANEFLTKACDNGMTESCYNLAISYANGLGVKRDYFKANELYKKL